MTNGRQFAIFWPLGLAAFAITVVLSLPLNLPTVPGGILDHQVAGSAEAVNAIHGAWQQAGLLQTAAIAMIADLIFIGLYGYGSLQGGLMIRRRTNGILRIVGTLIAIAAVVFTITDYGETIAQLIQLRRNAGSDQMAAFAATMQPIKSLCFMITFVGIVVGMILARFTHLGASQAAADDPISS